MRLGPEAREQIAVVRVLRMILTPPAMAWWCPNGSYLSTDARRMISAAMGLLPGVGDLHLTWCDAHRGYYGVIEMKRPDGKGVVSDDQTKFGDTLQEIGHYWAEAKNLSEVLAILVDWGVPHRHIEVLPSGATRMRVSG